MALTATCTEKLRIFFCPPSSLADKQVEHMSKTVSILIGLRDELVVPKSPCKNNNVYSIESAAIEEVFMPEIV